MKRRNRSVRSLRRRRPRFAPRECVLVVCEGAKTEPSYFHRLRDHLRLQNNVEVTVDRSDNGSAPISVVDYAIGKRAARVAIAKSSPYLTEFDVVWCVIDVEAPQPHKSLHRAVDKAQANRLRVALSNPCFEYWYILHFEKTSALFQYNSHVIKRLRRQYPRYKKNDPDFFDEVYPRTESAVRNARQVIKERGYGEDLRNCNPSTHVHRVVEHLRQIANRPMRRY